jgi:8-oxo-dGTP pyrophosphatase MutT (NUDIX family)
MALDKISVISLLEEYQSIYYEEVAFKNQIIDFVRNHDDFISRKNIKGHLTSSAWVVNPQKDKVILIHHQGLDKWFQMGGHIEEYDTSILESALREAKEESGIFEFKIVSDHIFDIDIHKIPKKNEIEAHLHYDIRMLLEIDTNIAFTQQVKEIKAIAWFSVEKLLRMNIETSIRRMLEKTQKLK